MATLPVTQLETFTGSNNLAPIINANFEKVELLFNPVNADHGTLGAATDVSNVIRDRVFGDAPEVLSGATPDIDFDTNAVKHFFGIDAATTFTFSNVGAGKFVFLVLTSSATPGTETLAWPAATDIIWLNAGGEPVAITEKYLLVKLWTLGGSGDADLVFGEYHVEP